MSPPDFVSKNRFAVILISFMCVLFLALGIFSTANYTRVISSLDKIELVDVMSGEVAIDQSAVRTTFSAELANPSRYDIQVTSVNWRVVIYNYTSVPRTLIVVASDYIGPTEGLQLSAGESMPFSYDVLVSDPGVMERLRGFINYSDSLGVEYDLDSLPYEQEFTILGWLGDFRHDYLRETYLNDLVKVDIDYTSGEGP
jgi:hypothetical protein